ncbi:hypothetical protein [Rhizobium glycinendophyticum]|uniref:Uncharacterized protein n=1 Tax=Rhizobium glycinendophyticum TaxID=2589807 RepID=A0A504U0L2_9HYPH|nr:hypothetical protein [Rhizobium glycinendophyticum]TPP07027.1 hypothetical protein FJQ55_15305 [Rhizobium glycinendophyticum]
MTGLLIASFMLLIAAFLMKPLRVWLQSCARQAEAQNRLVEEYYRSTTRFVQLTSSSHAETREILVWVGHHMMRGTRLITSLILTRMKNGERDTDSRDSRQKSNDPLAGVSDEARHAFSEALAAALLVSSYHSFFWGPRLRSMLKLTFEPKAQEVREPAQFIIRYRQASKSRGGRTFASAG